MAKMKFGCGIPKLKASRAPQGLENKEKMG